MSFGRSRESIKRTLKPLDFPKSVVIETTAYCNLNCVMCPQSFLTRPRGNMSMETFRKIADEVSLHKKTKLWLAIMGEPLMRGDDLISFIKYAKQKGIGNVSLNTNAMLMTSEMSIKLIESGLDTILIGIDAYKKDTYNKIRIGGDFDKVVFNVLELLEHKVEFEPEHKLKVIVQYIVMEENEKEVKQFKQYWLSRGAIVKIRPKLGWGAQIQADNLNLREKDRTYPCPWLTRTVSIRWDGNFNQCDADWDGQYSPGNIYGQSIKDIWDGELSLRRQKHWDGDFRHELCSKCKDWQVSRSRFYYPKEINVV